MSLRQSVTVDAVEGQLGSVLNIGGFDVCSVELINDDVSQTINARLQFSTGSDGPWADAGGLGLWEIAPLTAKAESHDVRPRRFARVLGAADGAGGVPARLTLDRSRLTIYPTVIK